MSNEAVYRKAPATPGLLILNTAGLYDGPITIGKRQILQLEANIIFC